MLGFLVETRGAGIVCEEADDASVSVLGRRAALAEKDENEPAHPAASRPPAAPENAERGGLAVCETALAWDRLGRSEALDADLGSVSCTRMNGTPRGGIGAAAGRC